MRTKPTTVPGAVNPRARLRPNMPAPLGQDLGPIAYRPLDSLRAYEKDPRKHPERQIVQLAASMNEFGFTIPILITEDEEVIAGHARLEAARRAGLKTVPVLVARLWSKAQIRAYRLADNRLAELGSGPIDVKGAI